MNDKIEKSLLQKVERLEAFEERLAVRLENISIRIDEYNWATIYCEIHPVTGTNIKNDLYLECVIYDKTGSILWAHQAYVSSYTFFGFELVVFQYQEDKVNSIGKIRIYPKSK